MGERAETDDDPRTEPLTTAGKRYIVRDHFAAVIALGLALGSAGTLGWLNAWVYGGVVLAIKAASALLLLRVDPAVLNARGTRHQTSKRERIFFAVYLPATLSMPVVAGLEVGRPGWTHRSPEELAIGLALTVAGAAFVVWALAHNAFFEPTVRLQRGRKQRVCTSGPYRIVRHPGYLGAIVSTAGIPLILGSYWCFVPFAMIAVAFVVRTVYEDRMLRDELEGYADYAERTRYRLLPFVW